MLDVIIIGSGPAGLSAAIYAARAGLSHKVIERNPMSGGQILQTYEVDNYPGLLHIAGFDMGMKFREHAEELGAEFTEEEVLRIEDCKEYKKVITDQGSYETKTIVFATGAHHAELNVPGEKELSGCGVSYCATCDGAFFKDKTVAVIGGGDVAVEDAIFLARLCKQVYLVHRRDTLRAAKSLQKQLEAMENVTYEWNSEVSSIEGDSGVKGVKVKNTITQGEKTLEVDGVFIAVGIHPDTELLNGIVHMDDAGYVIAQEDGESSCPGIYVAGDCRKKKLRQVITAAADGANAIASVQEYI